MEIIDNSGQSLTIRMTPGELRAIRQSIVIYYGGVSAISLFRGSHAPHIASVKLEAIVEKIDGRSPIQDAPANNPQAGTNDSKMEWLDTTLDIQEWAAVLFILNVLVYGCVVTSYDLYCITGLNRDVIKSTMIALHNNIENYVYRIAAAEKIRLKRDRPNASV